MDACQLLSEVYETAKQQVKAAMSALKEELSLHRADVEKQISAGLQQASLLHDHITHTITGACLCLRMSGHVKRGRTLCPDNLCWSVSSHPRWHMRADVTVSPTHDRPETRPYSAGSGHAHLWWVCIYLAILPGDVWWYHRPGIDEHIS